MSSYLFHLLLALLSNLLKLRLRLRLKMSFRSDEPYAFRPFVFEERPPERRNLKVPLPRSGHRVVADDTNLYSFGGYNPLVLDEGSTNEEDEGEWPHAYPLFQELWKFNFASRRWTSFGRRETLPLELASNAVVRHGNLLMVYGGTGSPFGHRCSNQLYMCRLNDERGIMWEMTTTGQPPPPQYGQGVIYTSGYLYAVGGTTGFAYSCDVHRLNMKTLAWEPVYVCQGKGDYEPVGRYRHEVAFDGRCIYVLGGGTAEEVYDFVDIPVFDLEKREWYKRRTLRDPSAVDDVSGIPAARRCHGAVQLELDSHTVVFVAGGYDGEEIFDDLWKLDLNTFQWTRIDSCRLPRPTYFHSTAVTPAGKLYVFGGIYMDNDDLVRSNEVFSTWLCVPKLSEMSWEALLKYNPGMVDAKRDMLIDAGLPRKFVDRLQ